MDYKNAKLNKLLPLYVLIFLLAIILASPPHLFSPPLFMPLRFPYYLEEMGPFLGATWPLTFRIYHLSLIVIGLIFSINLLAITFPKWRMAGVFSSFFGIFLTVPVIIFFFAQFTKINLTTAIIYGLTFVL